MLPFEKHTMSDPRFAMTFMVAFMTAFTVARCTIHHAIDFRRRNGVGKTRLMFDRQLRHFSFWELAVSCGDHLLSIRRSLGQKRAEAMEAYLVGYLEDPTCLDIW